VTKEGVLAAYRLALGLLKETDETQNQLLSPLSVMLALGMTSNGAEGETKAQMEQALGMTTEEMNVFLSAVLENADGDMVNFAQSIWFKDGELSVLPAFLQTNADYYGADAYAAKFDASTVRDINRWVEHHTDGMIDKLLEQIDPYAMMYLISALAFDAKWETPYQKSQITKDFFFTADGTPLSAELMHSEESRYLSQSGALGVLKSYEGGRYAFAGILPPEGMSPADYLASLSADDLTRLVTDVQYGKVDAKIPAFTFAGDYLLNDALKALGMELAFTDDADFSKIDKTHHLYIDEVKHKTFIDVSAEGTRAAAVTSVGLNKCTAAPDDTVYIHLNRPFAVVLLDTQTGLPLFVGTVNTVD
jgi:serpin B